MNKEEEKIMKSLLYQENAINELTDKVIKLLNLGGKRRKIVFEAPTGAGKTVMACQTLANIADELKNRGECRYREVAYIWVAPRKLHLQSYASLKGAFQENHRLRPIMFDELEQSEGIQPGEILFVNWESVNKVTNVMARDSESSASIYEIARKTQEEFGVPIVVVIDEEHMFWSKTADKSAEVLNRINPAVEIRISATPKTQNPDEKIKVYRNDVIEAEMIKKEVVLNPEIEMNFSDELALNANLIRTALAKRNQLEEAYGELGVNINPLLLIQLPNDTGETMTAEDNAITEQVRNYLRVMCDITEENGRLAVWLANEKSNLNGLEKNDNMTQVLLFKEAIALGWDCPRAAVLLIFRKLKSEAFTIQTVGRILRMPEQKHYPNELLNVGYVYTDIAKDRIEIVTADGDYISKNSIIAHRRKDIGNVTLKAYYAERPNVERNYLGPDFRTTLYEAAYAFWKIERGAQLFTIAEMAELLKKGVDYGSLESSDDEQVNANRINAMNLSQNAIRLDVKNINVEIPKDVHFQNEVQVLEVEQMKYARKANEVDQVFMAYTSGKGHQFESKGRTDKIASFLLELLADFFEIYETDAKKVVLYHENKPKFDRLLDIAFTKYAEKRMQAKRRSVVNRQLKQYNWELPEERLYDGDTNKEVDAKTHALQAFVQLKQASNPEKEFVKYLEQHAGYIDWWYKNGDKGKQHYAIPYGEEQALFYVDFVVRMKNGNVYLFDTKSIGSDIHAAEKHNALISYMEENSTEGNVLLGGILIQQGSNWLYCKRPIENTNDLSHWDCFYPENA